MLEIRDLSQTSPVLIFEAYLEAFSDYFVPLNTNFEDNLERWEFAGVDLGLSFGAFLDEKLVAFVLHARHDEHTVFNLATGVVPELRGQRAIDEIYARAFSKLQEEGLKKIRLEVLIQNTRAQGLYARLGFQTVRKLHSFKGELPQHLEEDMHGLVYHVKDVEFSGEARALARFPWSTEQSEKALLRWGRKLEMHEIREDGALRAFAVFHPPTLRLMHVEAAPPFSLYAMVLLRRMKLEGEHVKMINVDEQNAPLLGLWRELGLQTYVDQWEMEREI